MFSAGAQSDRAAIRVDHDVRNISFAGHNVTEGVHGVGAGTVGREPGRTGGRRGTEEEREGSGISTMAGSGREIQKAKIVAQGTG